MSTTHSSAVFLSHASEDDAFVRELRKRMELRGFPVLDDATEFRVGEDLPRQIREAIDKALHFVALITPEAAVSDWVPRELRYAQQVAAQRPRFRVVPLLLPNATTDHLRTIFRLPEPAPHDPGAWPPGVLALSVTAELDELLPKLLDVLHGKLPEEAGLEARRHVPTELADLVLRLTSPRFELVRVATGAEVRRPVADATLAFYPPQATEPAAESPPFRLVAPLGKIEAGDLAFYLERYHITPYGKFTERAREIEGRLPLWGQDLWDALEPRAATHAVVLRGWRQTVHTNPRRFTIELAPLDRPPRTADAAARQAHAERQTAATELLGLPWELLHDGQGYLFHDGLGVRVRRSLPGGEEPIPVPDELRRPPLRVLIVCARPEADGVAYIDHRVSVRPLVEALNSLGELARYDLLTPPTFPALCERLRQALAEGRPYHLVHFDGHGVYDPTVGLGGLVFEAARREPSGVDSRRGDPQGDPPDGSRRAATSHRPPEIITADRLGAELRHAGVGLFFLEACQTAKTDERPDASVAGKLLQSGVASVVAMSHSVLVETARQFTSEFYPALVRGERVGEAMLHAQRKLYDVRQRGWGWQPIVDVRSANDRPFAERKATIERCPLELQDWFVPVLYQCREKCSPLPEAGRGEHDLQDPVLLTAAPPSARAREGLARDRAAACQHLPPPPPHAFVGRSRELLAAERLLIEAGAGHVLFRGEGGEGKTTLAVELARWLVDTRRLDRAAFASVEHLPDARALVWEWGKQLVAGFGSRAGDSLDTAEQLILRTLRERPAVLVLDNLETLLPPPADSAAAAARVYDAALLQAVLALCGRLLDGAPRTRLIITSRESIPVQSDGSDRSVRSDRSDRSDRFSDPRHELEISRLSLSEGCELVARVLAATDPRHGVNPEALQAAREAEIENLVRTVNGHARALVLLTPELARRGLTATTEELAEIMTAMERRYPGDRERSLFASLELSLRRLPKGLRAKLAPLGVFQGGCVVQHIAWVCDVPVKNFDELMNLAQAFIDVGLAELIPLSVPYLRFDPALAPALLRELQAADDEQHTAEFAARRRWADAYRQLARFLYQQKDQDAHLAANLTLLELPNLLAALRLHEEAERREPSGVLPLDNAAPGGSCRTATSRDVPTTPEGVIDFATDLESLLQNHSRRDALAEASSIRETAHRRLEEANRGWSKTALLAAHANIVRLRDQGRIREALAAAKSLAQKSEAVGDGAYPGADYDRAMAFFTLGRAHQMAGEPEAALAPLARAGARFESLATTMPDADQRRTAARMASVCLTDEADCSRDLGQLDDAAAKYEEAIRRDEKRGDRRDVAIGKSQLATVRLEQGRYADALALYHESRRVKESLGESPAVQWHQIGIVYENAGDLGEAEAAYLRSLALEVQAGNKPGEAATRIQLGNLYDRLAGRREEAVRFFLDAAAIYAATESANPLGEGQSRANAAITLIALGRYAEARVELTRALECIRDLGPNAEPWKTWAILHDLETAVGNPSAAADARQRALATYESARRRGWQIPLGNASRFAPTLALLLASRATDFAPEQLLPELRFQLPQLETDLRQELTAATVSPDVPPENRRCAAHLLAILDGARDPSLAADPALHYADAVDLKLLLE